MTDKRVFLDLRNWQATSNDTGYHDATTSGGSAKYCYRYTEGDDGAGGLVHKTNSGAANITVILHANPRYKFNTISFTGDNDAQLSTEGNAAYARVIKNRNTSHMDARYHVTIKDSSNDVTISCDPQIRNTPTGT